MAPQVIFTFGEYGGIWWSDTETDGWGYGAAKQGSGASATATTALLSSPKGAGFTQLTDVEQEKTGLHIRQASSSTRY